MALVRRRAESPREREMAGAMRTEAAWSAKKAVKVYEEYFWAARNQRRVVTVPEDECGNDDDDEEGEEEEEEEDGNGNGSDDDGVEAESAEDDCMLDDCAGVDVDGACCGGRWIGLGSIWVSTSEGRRLSSELLV